MGLLQVEKLTMRFGGLTAVNQVDLDVAEGKIYSVIGPNGAGKTTVFNAITGIYEPTSGAIRFQGKQLRRPFAWYVLVSCLLIGLATGVSAALLIGNIDKLWRAAIRRNLYDAERPFTYANAWREAAGYYQGRLGIERQTSGAFAVVNANATLQLAQAPTRREAEHLRSEYEALIDFLAANPGAGDTLIAPDSDGVVLKSPGGTELASFLSRDIATKRLQQIADIPRQRAAFQTLVLASLLGGFVLGTTGAGAVWSRSRATPDVMALGGLARTFQNIRLFRDMTVLENVLVGMDRRFSRNVLATVLRLPSARAEERLHCQEASALLEFVGMAGKRHLLARNLPYGDQRRLEIARALATEPKLILLDEPAAGMNPAESDDLMRLVHRIRERGITVVLIEHHMKLVMNISDHIAVLDHGEKIAEGTPAEVKANPRVIEAYLGKEEVS